MKKYLLIPILLLGLNLNAMENTTPKAGTFVWNELATTDVQAAKDFYGQLFGWDFVDQKMGDMTYTMIKKDNKEFGGIWTIPTEMQNQIPSHWLSYILVDNLEQSLEMARQNGATIVKGIQKAGDKGLFAIIKDPVGAHIALWQCAK